MGVNDISVPTSSHHGCSYFTLSSLGTDRLLSNIALCKKKQLETNMYANILRL